MNDPVQAASARRSVRPDPVLAVLLVVAFVLRVAAATALPNIAHPDEIFQTLEPALRLWNGRGVVTWEWIVGIRSWVFPGVLAAIMRVAGAISSDPAFVRAPVAGVLSALSLGVVVVGWRAGHEAGGRPTAFLVAGLAAVWPELVHFAPKALNEVVAAHVLILVAWGASGAVGSTLRRPELSTGRLLAVGFGLALALGLRLQLAPAVAAIAWWVARGSIRRWSRMIAGGLLPAAVFGGVDAVALGSPFQSIWKNVVVNLVEGRAAYYGTDPWHWYADEILRRDGPIAVLLLAFFALGARRAPLLAGVAGIVWLTHIVIGHKELRFLYPAAPFAVIVAGLGVSSALDRASRLAERWGREVLHVAALGLTVALAVAVSLRTEWRDEWRRDADRLVLAHILAERSDDEVCGIGLVGVDWWHSGGVTHIARSAPIHVFDQSNPDLGTRPVTAADLSAFDWAMTRRADALPAEAGSPWRREACRGSVCLWHRPGGCRSTPETDAARLDRVIATTLR